MELSAIAQNLRQWVWHHGLNIVIIMATAAFLLWLCRIVGRRLIRLIVIGVARAKVREAENRAQTLVGVFQNAARIVVIVGAVIMLLAEIGVDVAPLLGGAAVVGLAVAFGAQNLLRDYFYGFIMLLENQYGVNDVIRVGSITGLVERITLRVTVLRDLEGISHFIPNGTITSISNLTYGWSRAVLDIGVAYKENVDEVMKVLMDLAGQMRRDPQFGPLILDEPEMLGVDQFADSAVVIKFIIKTEPMQKWPVKRELLRRIKNKFDELGIEIPFPHRTVYHRTESQDAVLWNLRQSPPV